MPPQNLIYLFSAYTIIFLVLFGYLVYVQQQVGDLKNQVRALRKRREPNATAGPNPLK